MHAPSYMGVEGGERIWAEVEARHAALLAPDAQADLLAFLADRFSALGAD